MISVIVPVYNVEKYLKKCVETIQNQTYTELEIILVDDGSQDQSGAICDELGKQDERIVVIHQVNSGQASARNAGLKKCKGEYVAFIDSDDTIELTMFETLIRLIEKSDSDIVLCGHQSLAEGYMPQSLELGQVIDLDYEELWEEIFGKLNNSVCNKLYKADLLQGLEFSQGIIHGEDLIFNLMYLARCKKGVLTTVKLYHYYRRAGSITRSSFNRNKMFEIVAKDKALEIVKKHKPDQVMNAEKYCFRARMNVIRSIYRSGVEDEYRTEIETYENYAQENYRKVRKELKNKEKIEYILLVCFKCMYVYLTRR